MCLLVDEIVIISLLSIQFEISKMIRGVRSLSTSARVKLPVQLFGLEARYANALFSSAVKTSSLPAVEADIVTLKSWLTQSPAFKEFLRNPIISRTDKKKDMLKITKGMNESTRGFMCILAENGRLSNVQKVISTFELLTNAQRGIIEAIVTAAEVIPAKQVKNIEKALAAGYLQQGQTLKLVVKVEPAIIGGLQVQIGDKFLDLSVASSINKVHNALV